MGQSSKNNQISQAFPKKTYSFHLEKRQFPVMRLAFVAFALCLLARADCYICPEHDMDFYGYDIIHIRHTRTWQECSALCSRINGCHYWTLLPSYHPTCYLKSSDGGYRRAGGAISGAR